MLDEFRKFPYEAESRIAHELCVKKHEATKSVSKLLENERVNGADSPRLNCK